MPIPKPDETRSQFISRCISYVKKEEGETNIPYIIAKCHGIWNQFNKKKKGEVDESTKVGTGA